MPMIGISRVCGSFFRARTGCHRSTTGISRSIRMTSGCSVTADLQPFSLSSAGENLKIADPLKAHLEHVEVVIVVFDVEHFGHVAVSILLGGRSLGPGPRGVGALAPAGGDDSTSG